MSTFFQKLFGNSENNKCNSQKGKTPQARQLRIESLESRELLAISVAEFNEIRAMYPDLGLTPMIADYNVIEIEATKLTAAALHNAITEAGTTPQSDLIVVRTTETQNKITLGGTELAININATARGSVTIVSLGNRPLTIDANQQSRVLNVSGNNTQVGLGGLTITKGQIGFAVGGGIYNSGILAITNCTILENRALTAAGICNDGTLTMTNSVISRNQTVSGTTIGNNGGGILNGQSSKATLTNCTISENKAYNGDGIYNHGTLILANSIVSANTGDTTIFNDNGNMIVMASLTMTDSTISGNNGIGIFSGTNSWVSVTDCLVSENNDTGIYIGSSQRSVSIANSIISGNSGNGVSCGSSTTVTNCLISENKGIGILGSGKIINCIVSGNFGGGISGSGTITNCAVSGNYGGGIYGGGGTITNSTIVGNSGGSGIYFNGGAYQNGTMTINNTIIAHNSTDITRTAGTIIGSNNLIGSGGPFTNGTNGNVVGVDPAFVNYSAYPKWTSEVWKDWDLRLTNGSPAIDKGRNDLAVGSDGKTLQMDLIGNRRIVGGTVDIGAYEYGSTPLNPPATPVIFRSTSKTKNSITLEWLTVFNAIDGYEIQYRKVGDEEWKTMTTTDTTVTISGLLVETPYEFQIRASNAAGKSDWSKGIFTVTSPLVPPVTPTNFRCTIKTKDSITLQWNSVNNTTGYEVQYRKSNSEEWTSVSITGTTTRLSNLGSDTEYELRIRAINNDGHSSWSTSIFVTTDIDPLVLPGIPTNFRETGKTLNSVTLAWNVVANATGYEIQYRKSGSQAWTNIPISGTSTTVSELTENTTYEFQVLALNGNGKSLWSESVFVTTNAVTTTDNPTNRIIVEKNTFNVLMPGGTFTFDLKHELVNTDSCYGFGLEIKFNPDYLECTKIGTCWPGGTTPIINNTSGIIYIVWSDSQGGGKWLTPESPTIIELVKALEFKLKEDAPYGVTPQTEITFGLVNQDRDFEADVPVITVNLIKATLEIDGDGVCDKYDALLLLRYANNLYKYDPAWADDLLWTQSQRTGADIANYLATTFTGLKLFDLDGDGFCDKYDALLLLRYTNNLHKYDPNWANDLLWQQSTRTGAQTVAFIESLWQPATVTSSPASLPVFEAAFVLPAPANGDILPFASDAPTNRIFVESDAFNVTLGETFTFDLKHELVNATSCLGFGLEIKFDPDYLECTGIESVYRLGSTPIINNTNGSLFVAWMDSQSGGAWLTPTTDTIITLLKTIEFKAKEDAPLDMTPLTEITFAIMNQDRGFEAEVPAITVNLEKQKSPFTVITTLDDGGAAFYDALANAKDGDTIIFDTGLSGTITLSGSQLVIDKSLKIDASRANITLDANSQSRVMSVTSGTTVTLVGLTITGGKTTSDGGGIINAGVLTLEDCIITGNSARRGGGISSSGTTTLVNTVISGNESSSYGGGVYIQRGTTIMEGCTVSDNHMVATRLPSGAMSGGFGGGIYNGGTLILTGGEITNNTALLFGGGGLYNEGRATIDFCFISGNEAEWGGGVSNSNSGTMTITGATIKENKANQGYGGIGNAGTLDLYDTIVRDNTVGKYGAGLGNNTGKVTLHGTTDIINNTPDNIWTNREIAETRFNTLVAPAGLSFTPVAPTYEISTPDTGELFAKTLTYWEFLATAISSSPIKDWEIDWGDSSEPTQILGGPRSRISVTHYFREAGTYSVTIKTTDFDGVVNTITIGTYTVKERAIEPLAVASIGPGPDIQEFSFEEPVAVSFAAPMQFTSENRFGTDYLSDLMETMRQRQMLDLDQAGQKAESVTLTELIWENDDLFSDEWLDFSEQPDQADFWSGLWDSEEAIIPVASGSNR